MTRTSLRIALFATLVAVLALVPSALAGKGRPGGGNGGTTGGSGTISLTLLNSTDGLAHYGQKVTFAVSATTTTQPWVDLKCSQNGVVVEQANGNFANSLTARSSARPPHGLAVPRMHGLPQDWSPQGSTLASMSFRVYA